MLETWYKLLISSLNGINEVFNNRELAIAMWLVIIAIYLVINKEFRTPILNVVRIAFCKKFVIAYFLMLLYAWLIVYLLYFIGLWNFTLIKDTIIWFLFTGIISAFRAIDKAKDSNYFKSLIKDYIKITLMLEFIVNLYTFSFLVEMILIAFIVIISVFNAIGDVPPVKKMFRFINWGLGLYIVCHAILLAFKDIENLESISTLRILILPPLLSIAFTVFTYLFALWSSYEQVFARISFGENKSKSLIAYVGFKIVLLCHLNIDRVNNFWKVCGLRILNIKCKADAIDVLNTYKEQVNRRCR